MKKFLVFASACLASVALSAQKPAVKSTPKPAKSTSSPAVNPAEPIKNQPVQKEAVMPTSPRLNNSVSDEPKKQTPIKQGPKQAKRSKLDANKNLKSLKKGAYQTAPETKQTK